MYDLYKFHCMARTNRKKIRIPKKSKKTVTTLEDINILLRIAEIYNTDYDFQAIEWFWGQLKDMSLFEEFRSKYPQGSKEAQLFERFTSRFELVGILVEYGFLNENLYFDRYGSLQIEWEKAKPIIYGLRQEWNDPRFRENFELLAIKGKKWLENHPPKIKGNEIDITTTTK
jgi:hypothetical protein